MSITLMMSPGSCCGPASIGLSESWYPDPGCSMLQIQTELARSQHCLTAGSGQFWLGRFQWNNQSWCSDFGRILAKCSDSEIRFWVCYYCSRVWCRRDSGMTSESGWTQLRSQRKENPKLGACSNARFWSLAAELWAFCSGSGADLDFLTVNCDDISRCFRILNNF